MTTLTQQQTDRLAELEAQIHAQVGAIIEKQNAVFMHFRASGLALHEIREYKL